MGDQLAGRVVLQAVIGRMVRMAQRDPRAGIDDYLAQLWCAISSYPLQRRPVRIAANLSMDTLKARIRTPDARPVSPFGLSMAVAVVGTKAGQA